MRYVIQNTDHGGFVAKENSRGSYVRALQFARTFASREAADRERCEGNETVIRIDEAFR